MRLVLLPPGLLGLLALLGCGAALQAPEQRAAARVDASIRAFLASEGIPAAHVTLFRGNDVILKRGYGSTAAAAAPPDATSMFPLGSVSKQFTAAAVLALADAGKLRIDAPVAQYLPEWFASEPDLRVSHLLSQTSGLADFLWLDGYRPLADDAATPIAAYIALATAAPRRFAPGARWAYSNTNYKVLALIVERVSGMPFDAALARLVLRPAGIDGVVSCHRLRSDGFVPGVSSIGKPTPLDASAAAYVGDGGLCASAGALAAWIRLVLAPRDGRFARLAMPAELADGTRVPYGFGISIREFLGRPMVWHGGNVDSHSTMIAYLPAEDLGIVILASRGSVWLTELMPALIGATVPARTRGSYVPLSGHFEDGLFRYEVVPKGETLRVKIDLIDSLDFVPGARGEYFAAKFPATFRIRLPPDGSRDRFELDWGEVRSYARRAEE